MPLPKDYGRQDCAIARSLEIVGERWTLLIVRDALFGVRRFSDFHAHLDVPKAVLSERLNGLVEHGILERQPDPEHSGRQLYELTEAWPGASGRCCTHCLCGVSTTRSRTAACSARGVWDRARCNGRLPHTARSRRRCEDIITEPRTGRAPFRDDPVAIALRGPHRLLEPVRA